MEGYIACILGGLVIGLVLGLWIHAKLLDKPEVVNNFESEVKIKNRKGIVNFMHRIFKKKEK